MRLGGRLEGSAPLALWSPTLPFQNLKLFTIWGATRRAASLLWTMAQRPVWWVIVAAPCVLLAAAVSLPAGVVWERTQFHSMLGIVCRQLLSPSPTLLNERNEAVVNSSSSSGLGREAGSEFVAVEGLLVLPQH